MDKIEKGIGKSEKKEASKFRRLKELVLNSYSIVVDFTGAWDLLKKVSISIKYSPGQVTIYKIHRMCKT